MVIGSSSEYDYSAVSVCRALKEEGISVVSVNSNPDTIMTDKNVADTVYIEPLNGETVKKIIEKEILLTAINSGKKIDRSITTPAWKIFKNFCEVENIKIID